MGSFLDPEINTKPEIKNNGGLIKVYYFNQSQCYLGIVTGGAEYQYTPDKDEPIEVTVGTLQIRFPLKYPKPRQYPWCQRLRKYHVGQRVTLQAGVTVCLSTLELSGAAFNAHIGPYPTIVKEDGPQKG